MGRATFLAVSSQANLAVSPQDGQPQQAMPEVRLRPLMQRFSLMPQEQPLFADVFGAI